MYGNKHIYTILAWLIKALLFILANNNTWGGRVTCGELSRLRREGEEKLRDINGLY